MIPDNVEKIIMTKEDYDRNVEQLLVEKLELEQELQRKDNIINELEKYARKEFEENKKYVQFDVQSKSESFCCGITVANRNILDKINELEGDKE